MESKHIVAVFPHTENATEDIDVEIELTQANFDFMETINPNITLSDFTGALDDNEIRYGVYTRPARRPRN